MQLNINGLNDRAAWQSAGIELPPYDVAALQRRTAASPRWAHFGIGNIFRIFLGGIADELICQGLMDTGITCIEAFDYDIVDRIYLPHDNLAIAVTLCRDGTTYRRVIGSLAECIAARQDDTASWERLKEIFCSPGLQMVSFTITEKGYNLRKMDGSYLDSVQCDIQSGPDAPKGIIAVVTAMLLERFRTGGVPIALVSMDNCSHNGALLHSSVLTMANEWYRCGFVTRDFVSYLEDPQLVSFPWSMIDKITPRPAEFVAQQLTQVGVEDMDIMVTSRDTYIAPFINAERPQYLVVEDSFPAGRPPLESARVYLVDRETVNSSERMKVTACLNPIHTALAPYGRLLKYEYFSDLMKDPQLKTLAYWVGYREGLPQVKEPGIFSAREFLDEVIQERLPNPYLGDTNARICTDSSQGMSVRFGETIRSYVKQFGTAEMLRAIPLAIAGWLRYFYGIDDTGVPFELSPDPLADTLHDIVTQVPLGNPTALGGQLRPVLSNSEIFGSDLYAAGIGSQIEMLFRELIVGLGAVRATLIRHLGNTQP